MKFAMHHALRRRPAAAAERCANTAPSAAAVANLRRNLECAPDFKVFCGAEAGEQA